MVGTFAAEEVAPHAAEIDRAGVRFADGEAEFPPRLAAIFDEIASSSCTACRCRASSAG